MLLYQVNSLTYRKRYDRPANKYSVSKNAIKSWSLFIQVRCDTSSGVKQPALTGRTGDLRLKVQRGTLSVVGQQRWAWPCGGSAGFGRVLVLPDDFLGSSGAALRRCDHPYPEHGLLADALLPTNANPQGPEGPICAALMYCFCQKSVSFLQSLVKLRLICFISLRRELWCFLCLGFGALSFGAVYQRVAISFRSVSALAFSISKSFRSWNTPVVKLHKS